MGRFPDRPVQVVDVDAEPIGKFGGRAEVDSLMGVVDEKLPLQKFQKQRRNALIGCLSNLDDGCIFMAKCNSSKTRFRNTSYL